MRSVPLWALLAIQVAAWLALGVRLWLIATPDVRPGIPIGIALTAVPGNVIYLAKYRSEAAVTWLALIVCVTFLAATLGKGSRLYPDYAQLRQKYGNGSREVRAWAWRVTIRIVAIAAVLLAVSFIFLRGILPRA